MPVTTLSNSSSPTITFVQSFSEIGHKWELLTCLTIPQDWLQTGGTWDLAAWLSEGCFPPGLPQGSLWLCTHDNTTVWGMVH